MIKNICNYKNIKYNVKTPKSFFTSILNDRRELGLQIADYQRC